MESLSRRKTPFPHFFTGEFAKVHSRCKKAIHCTSRIFVLRPGTIFNMTGISHRRSSISIFRKWASINARALHSDIIEIYFQDPVTELLCLWPLHYGHFRRRDHQAVNHHPYPRLYLFYSLKLIWQRLSESHNKGLATFYKVCHNETAKMW
jgi:hypothetical protein